MKFLLHIGMQTKIENSEISTEMTIGSRRDWENRSSPNKLEVVGKPPMLCI